MKFKFDDTAKIVDGFYEGHFVRIIDYDSDCGKMFNVERILDYPYNTLRPFTVWIHEDKLIKISMQDIIDANQ